MASLKSLCSNLIPNGRYKAMVTEAKFDAGASRTISVTLTISEGNYAKRTLTEKIPEKARSFKLMPLLTACKVDVERDFATDEEVFKFGFASAKNKTILIDVGTRQYQGQDYNTITAFYPEPDSTTSVDEVALNLDENPEVKGNDTILDGAVVEENVVPTEDPAESNVSQEPTLDIDLNDVDDTENPF